MLIPEPWFRYTGNRVPKKSLSERGPTPFCSGALALLDQVDTDSIQRCNTRLCFLRTLLFLPALGTQVLPVQLVKCFEHEHAFKLLPGAQNTPPFLQIK